MTHRVGHPARLRNPIRSALGALVALMLFAAVSGCGLLSGSKDSSIGDSGSGQVEKAKIALGVMPILDAAPVHVALKKGYFKQEGLEVVLTTIQGGAAGIPGLVNGDLDFTFGNWVSFFAAETKGVAKGVDGIKLASDGYQARQDVFLILTPADSPIKSPKDLTGKKIAINTFNNIVELTARATLEANGVDPKSVTFKEFPFPDMQAALQNKQVDATFMVEPFITKAKRAIGAIPIVDAASGPTADIPIAGYATTGKFAKQNPKTVDAFRRALAKGQQDAAQRAAVEEVLPEYAKIDQETAASVHFGVYPTSLDATRLQRVADLMKTYGLLAQPMDIKPMLIGGSTG